MAFSDVIDSPNADRCLLAVIEPKYWSGGNIAFGSKLYISERYITCPTFVPGDSGNYYFNGIVDAWGEFGYVGNASHELLVSDGSVLLRNDRPFGEYGSFSTLLNQYELQGANIWIGQMLVEIVAGSVQRRAALIFSGVISDLGDIKKETVELMFTDHTATTPVIPFSEVTRVDFPNAPEESIGKAIPIVMGDFSEGASPYTGTSRADLQTAGCGNLAGVPTVLTDKKLTSYSDGPDYRISDHLIKELHSGSGAMLLEPEEEIPGLIHPDDWALVNSSYAGIETDWPVRVMLPLIPDGRGHAYMDDSNPMLACDNDLSTVSVIDPDPSSYGYLTLVPRNVSQLGKIQKVEVCCWVKAGGNGHLYLSMTKDTNWYGTVPYTDFTLTGNEEICKHEVVLSNNWPSDEWNFDRYELEIYVPPSSSYYMEIRELWLLVTYVPNRAHREKKVSPWRGLWGGHPKGFGVGKLGRPANRELWWPTHNPTVLAYAKGIKDDGSGTYTGTADALIENGADVAYYLADNYLKLPSSQVETGTAIGNFGTARTDLGTHHKLALFIDEKMQAREQYELLCQECRSMPVWNSDGKFGMVAIKGDPVSNYRGIGDVFDWMPDEHFLKDSFRCWRSPVDQVATRVFIEFDYCHGIGKFRKTAFITPDGTDNGFGTDDDDGRKTAAGMAEDFFGPGREFRLKAYDVRNQGVAKALRNFYADNLRTPRVCFEFECGVHACDLSVGNLMHFGVERINGMRVPQHFNTYTGAEDWDEFHWYVAGVTRLEQEGDVSRYLVRGFEAFEIAYPGAWVAAADD